MCDLIRINIKRHLNDLNRRESETTCSHLDISSSRKAKIDLRHLKKTKMGVGSYFSVALYKT